MTDEEKIMEIISFFFCSTLPIIGGKGYVITPYRVNRAGTALVLFACYLGKLLGGYYALAYRHAYHRFRPKALIVI